MVPDTNRNGVSGTQSCAMRSASWPLKPGIEKSLRMMSGDLRRKRVAHRLLAGHAPMLDRRGETAHRAHDQLGVVGRVLDHQHVQRARPAIHQSGTSLAIIQYMPTCATMPANASKSTGLTT